MGAMDKFKKHFGKFEDLTELVHSTEEEDIYLCPYCPEIVGTPDTKGKFSYNTIKTIGHCWRCESVIIHDGLRSIEAIQRILKSKNTSINYPDQKLYVAHWSKPISEDIECLQYMRRRKLNIDILEKYNVRATQSPYAGIVLLNKLIDTDFTDYLQIRALDSTRSLRYNSVKDLVKPLSWIDHIDTEAVAIVEGFISGLAAKQYVPEYLSPLILTGKSISNLQLSMLSEAVDKYSVKSIFIILDGGYEIDALKIARTIYPRLVDVEVFLTKLPRNTDPNELDATTFRTCLQKSIIYNPISESIVYKELR